MPPGEDGEQWLSRGTTGRRLAFRIDMFTEKRSFGSYVWTFALGALTGATVALLFAPMTGKKMQRKVANATERFVSWMNAFVTHGLSGGTA